MIIPGLIYLYRTIMIVDSKHCLKSLLVQDSNFSVIFLLVEGLSANWYEMQVSYSTYMTFLPSRILLLELHR